MIHSHPTDAEAAGRMLHSQLVADARRVVGAWVEEPHPDELRAVVFPPPDVPRTNEMPAVGAPRPGRHRAKVTRLRPPPLPL